MLTSPPRHLTFRGSARGRLSFFIGLGRGGYCRFSGNLSSVDYSVDVALSPNCEWKSGSSE